MEALATNDVVALRTTTKGLPSRGLTIAIVVWLGAAIAGTWALLTYKQQAGIAAVAPKRWPVDTQVSRDGRLPTLVMIVHPKCTCSRASVGELAKLMSRLDGRVAAQVLFVRPQGAGSAWEDTDLFRSASAIPGVDVRVDAGGVEAGRFGARTSGQTYLYSPDGTLMFSGGITAGRGHHGDNAGSKSILAIVTERSAGRDDRPATDVYGCSISDPSTAGSTTFITKGRTL